MWVLLCFSYRSKYIYIYIENLNYMWVLLFFTIEMKIIQKKTRFLIITPNDEHWLSKDADHSRMDV